MTESLSGLDLNIKITLFGLRRQCGAFMPSDLSTRRRNKKIGAFRITGFKIIGRVGMCIFFSGKTNNMMHFESHFAFQNAPNYIFFQKT